MRSIDTVKDTIKDYGRKSPFASFLPGIAGLRVHRYGATMSTGDRQL